MNRRTQPSILVVQLDSIDTMREDLRVAGEELLSAGTLLRCLNTLSQEMGEDAVVGMEVRSALSAARENFVVAADIYAAKTKEINAAIDALPDDPKPPNA